MEKRNNGRKVYRFWKNCNSKVGLSGEKMLEIDIKRRIGEERNSQPTIFIRYSLFFFYLLSSSSSSPSLLARFT